MISRQDRIQLIKSESERLIKYLGSISADAWTLPSACGLWEVRDVAAHLVMVADLYGDTVSRGIQGDSSPTDGFPASGSLDPASFDDLIAEKAIAIRKSEGDSLLDRLGSTWERFNLLLGSIGPEDWGKPCYHIPAVFPAERFVLNAVQELAIHEWDMRSRIEPGAPVSSATLPTLMERIPRRFGPTPGYDRFLMDSENITAVRYRFQVTGGVSGQWDIIVEEQRARMEETIISSADVTFQCDTSTFVMLMYKRLVLDQLLDDGRISVQGHPDMVAAFNSWLKGE